MTSNPNPGWPAQKPAPDFAARTVAAILRDRNERRERQRGSRWLLVAAAAAVTMAGGAFAWTSSSRPAKPSVEIRSTAAPPRPVDSAVNLLPMVQPPEPRKQPPPLNIVPPRRKGTPFAPSSSAPDGGRRVILPRCNCQEAICDCLEKH